MYRIFSLLLFLVTLVPLSAQESITSISIPAETPGTNRVYAELLGYGTNLLGLNKNVTVNVDLGQYQSAFKPYSLLDENGKVIKFNSMVAAMNYMGERGWKFVQAYIVTAGDKQNVYHWLMYKDIVEPSQIYEGLQVSNTESEPAKKKKKPKSDSPKRYDDDIYGK